MTAFRPNEIHAPVAVMSGPVLPFDGTDGKYLVARDEEGRTYHSPICTDFVRHGTCIHLEKMRQRAEHPRIAFHQEANSLAIFGVNDGRPLTAIAADIGDLAREQSQRQHFKEEWEARQARTEEERRVVALESWARHSKSGDAA